MTEGQENLYVRVESIETFPLDAEASARWRQLAAEQREHEMEDEINAMATDPKVLATGFVKHHAVTVHDPAAE